jgi:hypothetical protein
MALILPQQYLNVASLADFHLYVYSITYLQNYKTVIKRSLILAEQCYYINNLRECSYMLQIA